MAYMNTPSSNCLYLLLVSHSRILSSSKSDSRTNKLAFIVVPAIYLIFITSVNAGELSSEVNKSWQLVHSILLRISGIIDLDKGDIQGISFIINLFQPRLDLITLDTVILICNILMIKCPKLLNYSQKYTATNSFSSRSFSSSFLLTSSISSLVSNTSCEVSQPRIISPSIRSPS